MGKWQAVGRDELKEGMKVRCQGYRRAFTAVAETVTVDARTGDGMAALRVITKGLERPLPVEAYFYRQRGEWGNDEERFRVLNADYSHLRAMAHNRKKIDRSRAARQKRTDEQRAQAQRALSAAREQLAEARKQLDYWRDMVEVLEREAAQ